MTTTAVLSKFRRKLLERREGTRTFIANGREAARMEGLEAAEQAHAKANEEQKRIAAEEAARKAGQNPPQ